MHEHLSMQETIPDIIGADEASAILGIDRSTLTRWIAAEKILPIRKLPGDKGAWLFSRAEIQRLADLKAAS